VPMCSGLGFETLAIAALAPCYLAGPQRGLRGWPCRPVRFVEAIHASDPPVWLLLAHPPRYRTPLPAVDPCRCLSLDFDGSRSLFTTTKQFPTPPGLGPPCSTGLRSAIGGPLLCADASALASRLPHVVLLVQIPMEFEALPRAK